MPQPLVGEIVPDFALPSTKGVRVRISDYRGKRNLVLILCGTGRSESVHILLRHVSELYSAFVAEEAELFAVVRGADREVDHLDWSYELPFAALLDRDERAHDLFGVAPSGQDSIPLVCIVDRYGEVRHISRAGGSEWPFGAHEILDWVRYLNLECPE